MHWVIEALANVFLETLGDMMSFAVQLLTDFKFNMGFNIGYDSQTSMGSVITGTVMGHNNLFEQTFKGVTSFTPWIMAFAAGLAMVIYITKMIIAMGGPFTKSEDPGTLTIRFIFACTGVSFAYTIVAMLEMTFNGIYGKFMETFVLLTKDAKKYAKDISKAATDNSGNAGNGNSRAYDNAPAAWHSNESAPDNAFNLFGKDLINTENGEQGLALTLIEIAVFVVLLVAFAKLLLEIYERYVMLGVLFFFAPLPFATVISPNCNILSSYIQMVISEFIVMCSNLFFTGIFIKAWVDILNTKEAYLFDTKAQFVTTMFLLISWLIIGQQFDQHLKGLGLSTATTGAGLGGAMMAGAGAAVGALSAAKSAAGFGAKVAGGQTNLQRGMRNETGIFSSNKIDGLTSTQKNADKSLAAEQRNAAQSGGQVKNTAATVAKFDAASGGQLSRALGRMGLQAADLTGGNLKNGTLTVTTPNGEKLSFYNPRLNGGKANSVQSKQVGGGIEMNMTPQEVQSKINSYDAKHPVAEGTLRAIDADGTVYEASNIKNSEGRYNWNKVDNVDGLVEGRGIHDLSGNRADLDSLRVVAEPKDKENEIDVNGNNHHIDIDRSYMNLPF